MTIQAATRGLEALGSAAIGLICRLEPAQLEVHRSKLGKLGWLIMAVLFFVVIGFFSRAAWSGWRAGTMQAKASKPNLESIKPMWRCVDHPRHMVMEKVAKVVVDRGMRGLLLFCLGGEGDQGSTGTQACQPA